MSDQTGQERVSADELEWLRQLCTGRVGQGPELTLRVLDQVTALQEREKKQLQAWLDAEKFDQQFGLTLPGDSALGAMLTGAWERLEQLSEAAPEQGDKGGEAVEDDQPMPGLGKFFGYIAKKEAEQDLTRPKRDSA